MSKIKVNQLIMKTASASTLSNAQAKNSVRANAGMIAASLVPNTKAVGQSNATTESGNNKEYAAAGFLPQRNTKSKQKMKGKKMRKKRY